jgi:hypothetical protein
VELNKKPYHFGFWVQGPIGGIFIPEVCDQYAFQPCLIRVEWRAISIDGVIFLAQLSQELSQCVSIFG